MRVLHESAPSAAGTPASPAQRPTARRLRPVLRVAGALAAAAVLPLLAAGWGFATHATAAPSPEIETLPTPPAHDPAKRTAVIVAGVGGAESLDVLVPYELLAATDAFNVYTVAPERRVLPLFPGTPTLQGTDFVPHYSLADFDAEVTTSPEVVVVPFVPEPESPANAALLAWLRERVTADTTLLTICGGSWVAAEAGLLDDQAATNHQNVLPYVQQAYPAVDWVDGQRWVQDGAVVSSAGITAAFDATLHVISELVGGTAARDVAQDVGYPHTGFLDDPAYAVPPAGTVARMLNVAYRWERGGLGVVLYDGVGEIELASVVDLYPRTYTSTIEPIGPDGGVVTTRNGLHLVPRHRPADRPAVDRIVIPGVPREPVAAEVADWTASEQVEVGLVHEEAGGRFAIDAVLHDLAGRDTRAVAALVARGIEYPIALADADGRGWPYELLLRPLLLALVGLLTVMGAARWRMRRGRRS